MRKEMVDIMTNVPIDGMANIKIVIYLSF
jgi:hypothetical protein